MKVVFDTNVLVSAFGWGGSPGKVFELFLTGKINSVTSLEIISEFQEVIFRKKFSTFDQEKRKEFLYIFFELSQLVLPNCEINACRDKKDNKFLEVAVAADVDFIISGDQDLLCLEEFQGVKILSPKQFLETFRG